MNSTFSATHGRAKNEKKRDEKKGNPLSENSRKKKQKKLTPERWTAWRRQKESPCRKKNVGRKKEGAKNQQSSG